MKTLELDITFSRDYYRKNFGIAFDEDYFFDVRTRVETDMYMKKSLFGKFGEIGLGISDPMPEHRLGFDDTLNIVLNFGGSVNIKKTVSWIVPGFMKTMPHSCSITVPPVPDCFPNSFFLEKYDEAARLYGSNYILPPKMHGILECALEMYGIDFYEYLANDKEKARYILDILTDTIMKSKDFWDIKCFGRVKTGIPLGSCSTTVISPAVMSELLVPRYNRLGSKYGSAFLCSCGPSTHNLENLAAVKDAYFVRVGWGTDMKKAADILKDRHLKASLSIVRAAGQDPLSLKKDVIYILESVRELERASLLLINAAADTPDKNIRMIVDTASEWANDIGAELLISS